MKIAFFGTSDKSTPILQSLNDAFGLSLCVTKKDTLVGRKQETRETGVKIWAREHNIPYLTIGDIKNDKDMVIDELKNQSIDLGIMADFSFIVPTDLIKTLENGIINIHFSLLPLLRGASPVQHAILHMHEFTGVTYYLMDQGMDTGDILDQTVYELSGTETAGSLTDTLFDIAARDIPQIVKAYTERELLPQTQDDSSATYCYSKTKPKSTLIDKNDARIDWKQHPEQIDAAVRAFNPWPIAWSTLRELETSSAIGGSIRLKQSINKDLRVKIYDTELNDQKLLIKQLQVEGKNKMDWESFKNGYTI